MRNYSAKNVDEYIDSADTVARQKLKEIREIIRSTVPEAVESISWGVPFYKYYGLLAGFSVFKNHITFGLAFTLDSKDRERLEKKGYITGKKTVQIGFDQKVPEKEIKKILKAKAKSNVANKAIK